MAKPTEKEPTDTQAAAPTDDTQRYQALWPMFAKADTLFVVALTDTDGYAVFTELRLATEHQRRLDERQTPNHLVTLNRPA
jgi:hypothetical protein